MIISNNPLRTRKDILEQISAKGEKLSLSDAGIAWLILMEWLWDMSGPEAPRTPKFRDVTNALEVILSPYEA